MEHDLTATLLSRLRQGPASTDELADTCGVPVRDMFEILFTGGRSLGLTGEVQGNGTAVWRIDRTSGRRNEPPVPPGYAFAVLSRTSARLP